MNKFIPFILIVVLIISGFQAIAFNESTTIFNNNFNSYTHTVLVEIGSCQDCSACISWDENISNIYNTGNYDFEYVEMIAWGYCFWDVLNKVAEGWANLYNIDSTPTSIFDGDYKKITGPNISKFPETLDESGVRSVRDIEGKINLTWLGDSKIQVEINIKNNEPNNYNGYIRVPITEIISRYKNSATGNNYHFAFLDYALNKSVSIEANGIYIDSIVWDGNEHKDNHNNNFGDIKPENIKVIMGVFNKDDNNYCDETVSGLIPNNQPPEKPTIDGPVEVKIDISYQYNFNTDDPDGDNVLYFIDWGDGTNISWIGPFESGIIISENHTWLKKGNYQIKVNAKDIYNWESETGILDIKVPRYRGISNDNLLNIFRNHFKIFVYNLLYTV